MIEVRGFRGHAVIRPVPGRLLLITGPNGAGKTSLLRAMAGLDAPLRPDSVRVGGDDPAALDAATLAARVTFIPQDAPDALIGLTVHGEARLRRGASQAGGGEAPAAPSAGIELLGIHRERDIATLSSGQARRVANHCAATTPPGTALLLDEPMESLDDDGAAGVLAWLTARLAAGDVVVATDHTGRLAALPHDEVRLDAGGPPPGRVSVAASGAAPAAVPVAHVIPASRIQRSDQTVSLPAIHLRPGLTALVGPNGSGKTTALLHIAGGFDDAPLPGLRTRMLTNRPGDHLVEPTVAACFDGAEAHIVRRLVPDALLARHPWALSGGEARRVGLAHVLGRPADLYLLDEPDVGLDAAGLDTLQGILHDLTAAGKSVVIASHDDRIIAAAHHVSRLAP